MPVARLQTRTLNGFEMKKVKNLEKPILYSENQRFRQIWIWAIIAIPVVISFYALIYQTFLGNHFGNPPMPDALVILFAALIGVALPISFYLTELRTRITDEGIFVKFFPIHRKWLFFSWNDVDKYEKVKYRPLLEYGGWGIRIGIHGKAYNVSGNMGILFTFVSGKRLLIGTQRPDEFDRALQEIKRG